MRIYEGRQATINKIKIDGNDRLYENVVRRELVPVPGNCSVVTTHAFYA